MSSVSIYKVFKAVTNFSIFKIIFLFVLNLCFGARVNYLGSKHGLAEHLNRATCKIYYVYSVQL